MTMGWSRGLGRPHQVIAPHPKREGMLQSDVEAAAAEGGHWYYGWVLRKRSVWPGYTEHTHIHPLGSYPNLGEWVGVARV